MVLRLQPWDLMRNGVAAFNGVLCGTVISCLYPAVYKVPMDLKMWIFICIGSIASVYICAAFLVYDLSKHSFFCSFEHHQKSPTEIICIYGILDTYDQFGWFR